MSTEKAREYWQKQKDYPFPFTHDRRIFELEYLAPKLRGQRGTLLDLGCGDGALLECLLHLTRFDRYIGCDVAEDLLAGVNKKVETFVYDLAEGGSLPASDITICAGVIQYVFDDEAVARVLREIKSPVLYLRSSCSVSGKNEPVEREEYASLYRTVPETIALLEREFRVVAVDRVYPDEFDSPFGTKQFYFEGRRN